MVKQISFLVIVSVLQISCGSNNTSPTADNRLVTESNGVNQVERLNEKIIGSWKIESVENQKPNRERILKFTEDGLFETPDGVTKYKVIDNSTIKSQIGDKDAFISNIEIEGNILTMKVEGKLILASRVKDNGNKIATYSKNEVVYLYQNNGGFTVYFSDGTYGRRIGEYTENDIKTGFKNIDINGKWAFRNDGIIEDNETLISFKTDDNTMDYGWVIINTKSAN